jgi:hypothetical protein
MTWRLTLVRRDTARQPSTRTSGRDREQAEKPETHARRLERANRMIRLTRTREPVRRLTCPLHDGPSMAGGETPVQG